MNRFCTSCAWLWPLSTEVAGSRPMRAVPISCTELPGGLELTERLRHFRSRRTPASATASRLARSARRRSFSPCVQSMCTSGSPQRSLRVACSVTRLSARGSISPKPTSVIPHGPGVRSRSLSSAPTPASFSARSQLLRRRVALETVAAQKIDVALFGEIDVSRQVEAGRAAAVVVAVEKTRMRARGADSHHVIHEMAADRIRAIREAARKIFRL